MRGNRPQRTPIEIIITVPHAGLHGSAEPSDLAMMAGGEVIAAGLAFSGHAGRAAGLEGVHAVGPELEHGVGAVTGAFALGLGRVAVAVLQQAGVAHGHREANRRARVITLEIEPRLARMARENLQRAGIANVEVREADGAAAVLAEGPFDVILLSGSVAEVPHRLLEQLKIGGRLGAITGMEPMMRATFIVRTGETSYTTAQPWDTVAPRLVHFPEPSRFRF